MEYDLTDALKESRGLTITFAKRIFQSAVPVSMTLLRGSSRSSEDQLLVADNAGKFKLFDKNTFEILATFAAPIYDANMKQFVSIYGAAIQIGFGLKAPIRRRAIFHPISVSRSSSPVPEQTFSFSQQTKTFAFTRCPSTEINFATSG